MASLSSLASTATAAAAASPLGQALTNFLKLSQSSRILKLHVPDTAPIAAQSLVPYQIEGEENLCGGVRYRLQCLGTEHSMPLKALQGLPVAFTIRTDLGSDRVVCGIVARCESILSDNAANVFELEIRDALYFLGLTRSWNTYSECSVIDITEAIFDRHTKANDVLGVTWKLSTAGLRREYPKRAFTLQAGESDASFMERLWRQEAIAWYYAFSLEGDTPVLTLILADNPDAYADNPAGIVRFHRANATEARDTVTAWHAWRRQSVGSTAYASFDYKAVNTLHAGDETLLKQGGAGDKLAATLAEYDFDPPQFGADLTHYAQIGRRRIEAIEFAAKGFTGTSSVRQFAVGTAFTLADEAEIDTHRIEDRRFILTRLLVQARNGIPLSDTTAAKLNANWPTPAVSGTAGSATTTGTNEAPVYSNHFECVRAHIPIAPLYDPASVPQIGPLSAIVISENGKEIDVDAMGRIAVRFLFARDDNTRANPYNSARVRVMHPWADAGYGAAFWPRAGAEVIIGFIQNHPDKPFVMGAVYDGRHTPPQFSGQTGLPANNALYGIRSQEVGGTGYGEIVFDDTTSQTQTRLASSYGATHLNLGWIGTPRSSGDSTARGEGFELRSDLSGALRAAQLLLSTDQRNRAGGKTLAREELIGELELALALAKQGSKLSDAHSTEATDTSAQERLLASIRHWEAGAGTTGTASIGITAPDGIALASPAGIHAAAGTHLDLTSMEDTHLSTGRKFLVRALQGISAFAHSLGIRLTAGKGDISIQAHNGDIKLGAANRLHGYGLEQLLLEAPTVLIRSEGASIAMAKGKITLSASAGIDLETPLVKQAGSYNGSPDLPGMPASSFQTDERIAIATPNGKAVPNAQYAIHDNTGATRDAGKTVADGASQQLVTDSEIKRLHVQLKP